MLGGFMQDVKHNALLRSGIHLSRDALQAEPVGAVREPPLRGFPSSAGILPAVDWRRMP